MLSSIFSKASELVDRRFLLGLYLPCLVTAAAIGGLVITAIGWCQASKLWHSLSHGERWLILGATTVVIFFLASVVGTQINPLIRIWEGYWRPSFLRSPGVRLQQRRYARLGTSEWDMTRRYREFPAEGTALLPTRLGNTLLAAERYALDRYGLDSVLFWPHFSQLISSDERQLIDDARLSVDQSVVIATLSLLTSATALVMACAKLLPAALWIPAALGTGLLCWLTYRSAVLAATAFGDLVRSVGDLHRRELLVKLGFQVPTQLDDEKAIWIAVRKLIVRGGVDTDEERYLRYQPPP